MEQVEAPSKLSRRLNTFDLTMIVIGSIIGSGIFITPSFIAQSLPSAGLILFVWTLGGLLALTGALAALATVYATYFGYFVPLSELGIKAVAIMGIILLTFINYFGVKVGGIFSDVFTLLKLIGICGLIFFGFLLGRGQEIHLRPLIPQLEGNLGAALAMGMVGVLWSYGGWQHAT